MGVDSQGLVVFNRTNSWMRIPIRGGTAEPLTGLSTPTATTTFAPTGVLPDGKILGLVTIGAADPVPGTVTVTSGTPPTFAVDLAPYANVKTAVPAGRRLGNVVQSGNGLLLGFNVSADPTYTLYELDRAAVTDPFPGVATRTIPVSKLQSVTSYDFNGLYASFDNDAFRGQLMHRTGLSASFSPVGVPLGLSTVVTSGTTPWYAWGTRFAPDCSYAVVTGSPGGASAQDIFSLPQLNVKVACGTGPACSTGTTQACCLTGSSLLTPTSTCGVATACTALTETHAAIQCDDDSDCEAGTHCYESDTGTGTANAVVSCRADNAMPPAGTAMHRICKSPSIATALTCPTGQTCDTPLSALSVRLLPDDWKICR